MEINKSVTLYKLNVASYKDYYWYKSSNKNLVFSKQILTPMIYDINAPSKYPTKIYKKFITDGTHALGMLSQTSNEYFKRTDSLDSLDKPPKRTSNVKIEFWKRYETKKLLELTKANDNTAPIDTAPICVYVEKTLAKMTTELRNMELDKAYSLRDALKIRIAPMLLGRLTAKTKVDFDNYYFQAKIDGHRAFIYKRPKQLDFTIIGRSGFDSIVRPPLIIDELKICAQFFKKTFNSAMFVIDGEFYNPDVDFETLSSTLRTQKNKNTDDINNIKLYVFDVVLLDKTPHMIASDRRTITNSLFAANEFKHIIQVPEISIKFSTSKNAFDQIHKKTKQLTDDGFEGIVMRDLNMPYLFNYRANTEIIKYKILNEFDYEIVGFTFGKTAKYAVVWVCALPNNRDVTFEVIPKATIAYRTKIGRELQNPKSGDEYFRKNFKGRFITVYYHFRTKNGIPKPSIGSEVVKLKSEL